MHTLSIFPDLLTFGLVAPTLLRITVGLVGILVGWTIFKNSEKIEMKSASLLYFVTGIFIFIGMYTQIFAIIGLLLVFIKKYIDKKNSTTESENKLAKILVTVILLSLLFTGPGFLAIDYPL